ncbi:unnamed protein product [Closterium sp. Naga37s-1]|nr:unnamed protein product [Closterium sp. Naga37s-1]
MHRLRHYFVPGTKSASSQDELSAAVISVVADAVTFPYCFSLSFLLAASPLLSSSPCSLPPPFSPLLTSTLLPIRLTSVVSARPPPSRPYADEKDRDHAAKPRDHHHAPATSAAVPAATSVGGTGGGPSAGAAVGPPGFSFPASAATSSASAGVRPSSPNVRPPSPLTQQTSEPTTAGAMQAAGGAEPLPPRYAYAALHSTGAVEGTPLCCALPVEALPSTAQTSFCLHPVTSGTTAACISYNAPAIPPAAPVPAGPPSTAAAPGGGAECWQQSGRRCR